MPLITCSVCFKEISDKADACPKCGNSNLSSKQNRGSGSTNSAVTALRIFAGLFGLGGLVYINYDRIFGIQHEIIMIEDVQEKPFIKFKTETSKKASDLIKSVDINHVTTRAFSLKIAQEYPGVFNINQVANIYRNIKEQWKYVNDPPNGDYYSKASETINNNLAGDCDDFAILMSALVSGIGGTTRITSASINNIGHAYTEVKIANSITEFKNAIEKIDTEEFLNASSLNQDSIYYRSDEDGSIWLNLDWTSSHIGGKYYEHRSITTFYPLLEYYLTNDPTGKKRLER